MLYDKTDKGREAVAMGPAAGLGLQDRRILILADGKRSLEQLVSMLGNDIRPRVERLARDGYIATRASAPPAPVPMPMPVPAMPSAPGTRRSLAAAKMYLLDMLQLQRTPEAAELRTAIQCTTDPAELVDVLLRALRELLLSNTTSYGPRVAARMAEILPEEALPRLQALRAEQVGGPHLSIVA